MGKQMKLAAQSVDSNVYMDGSLVGNKVTPTVMRRSNYLRDQQERFKGNKDYV